MIVRFTIPGEPFGKQRPRHLKNGHTYTPRQTTDHETAIKYEYRRQCGYRFPTGAYISIGVIAFYKIPSSATKSAKGKMLAGTVLPSVKPDVDNVLKLIMDALEGECYGNDKNVIHAQIRKEYSENPRTEVYLWD